MTYLAAAFVAVWLLIGFYVVYIGQRQRRIDAEIETLRALVEENQR